MDIPRHALGGSPFAAVTDAEAELRQLANIRIAAGLLCLARLAPPIWASSYFFEAATRFERRPVGSTQFARSGEGNTVRCEVVSSTRLPDRTADSQSDSHTRP